MRLIRKLDKFILKSFLLLFAGTFFICLFIFMMQFLWKYVDELVGKGLALSVLAKFFFFSALTLVPTSLPLAILLASLMTFGNFGERYELLSMKAAGISLMRIMMPLIVFSVFLGGVSFYFQNVIAPYAQVKLWTLIVSMREKSPELDIPEGVFYDQINKYNLYVKRKNRDNGMLYDVKIYDFTNGFANAHIIVADSGKLEMTADKKYLKLTLYRGEQFENLQNQSGLSRNVPYRRESFSLKTTLISFDSSFSMVDGSFMSGQSMSKNMPQLQHDIDSMHQKNDSLGQVYYKEGMKKIVLYDMPKADSGRVEARSVPAVAVNVDSIYDYASISEKKKMLDIMKQSVNASLNDWRFKSYQMSDSDKDMRKHQTEWFRKITLSLACIIFFFIGSPLGAIIRRGGLGMPVVVSVVLFIFYYVIDNTGYKMARDGNWVVWIGMCMSSGVLILLGAFLTYKANKDSTVLNADAYKQLFRKVFLLRAKRHFTRKEVVLAAPDAAVVLGQLDELNSLCAGYIDSHKLNRLPSYLKIWTDAGTDSRLEKLNELLEEVVEELSNSRNLQVISKLNTVPVLALKAHLASFKRKWANVLAAVCLPVGVWFYVRACIFRKRLWGDLSKITDICGDLKQIIQNNNI